MQQQDGSSSREGVIWNWNRYPATHSLAAECDSRATDFATVPEGGKIPESRCIRHSASVRPHGPLCPEGPAQAAQIVTEPIAGLMRWAGIPTRPLGEIASGAADAMGLPKPQTAQERVVVTQRDWSRVRVACSAPRVPWRSYRAWWERLGLAWPPIRQRNSHPPRAQGSWAACRVKAAAMRCSRPVRR